MAIATLKILERPLIFVFVFTNKNKEIMTYTSKHHIISKGIHLIYIQAKGN